MLRDLLSVLEGQTKTGKQQTLRLNAEMHSLIQPIEPKATEKPMSTTGDTLRVLILAERQADAENTVSLLRNSGHATRAHLVESVEDFAHQLQKKPWDLLLAEIESKNIHYSDLQAVIRRLNKDLPIILISPGINLLKMADAIKHGVVTVVPREETNLLVLAIQRELRHLHNRRELRELQVRLREAEKRTQALLESSRDGVAYISDGMHIHANSAYLQMFGYETSDDLLGMPIMDMVEPSGQSEFKQFLKKYMAQGQKTELLNTIGQSSDDKLFPMTLKLSPATFQDESCTQVIVQAAIPNPSPVSSQIKEMNNLDSMTGLHNKPFFMTGLENAVDSAVLAHGQGAVIYINIDGFGKIKRDVGITDADKVLVQVANALKAHYEGGGFLARLGEDIFTVILMEVTAEEALHNAETTRAMIEELLIDIGNQTLTVTASIGVALINETSSKPEAVLQQAHYASDSHRDNAGDKVGNRASLFEASAAPAQPEPNKDMESLLADALKNNSFVLLFQPLISLKGEDSEHYEVLLRLPNAAGELTSAGEFIHDTKINEALRRKVDRWVILNAIKRLAEHYKKGHKTRIFINLSGPSLLDESLPGWISVAARAARLPKGSLIVQFNEDSAARMLKQAQTFSKSLEEKGICTALSRFGCSINPLKNLQHINVNYVKVDGSFTQELSQNEETRKQLVELLEQLHEQEKVTVLPLVENAAALANLWQMGVHYIQGFYVQEPREQMAYSFEDESSF